MSTRARIGLEYEDGSVRSIYNHNDGYLEGLGVELLNRFHSREDVKSLLSKGDLSHLDLSYKEWRDEHCPAENHSSRSDYVKYGESFHYLFTKDERWEVCTDHKTWQPLEKLLKGR